MGRRAKRTRNMMNDQKGKVNVNVNVDEEAEEQENGGAGAVGAEYLCDW
jgi:hypothetical protein